MKYVSDKKQDHYSIKDLEKLSGIKAHTIRIWEKRYNVIKPLRTETNIRFYSDIELKKLLNIAMLNKMGFRISQLALLDKQQLEEEVQMFTKRMDKIGHIVDSLILAMLNYDGRKFEKVLNKTILAIGFEKTMNKLIRPFFERVGVLWQTGAILPAQEHFVTNIVRQKLIVAMDGLSNPENTPAKSFLLMLPEGEMHELGLLYYQYILLKAGHKVKYFGQWVPVSDIKSVLATVKVDVVATTVSSGFGKKRLVEDILDLASMFPDIKFIAGGFRSNFEDFRPTSNIILPNSFDELISMEW